MPRRLLAAAAIVLLPLIMGAAGVMHPLENWLTAERMRLAARPPTGNVALIDIDPKSINAIGSWPWPRRIYAQLIDKLTTLGAAEIAFDVDFSTKSTPEDDAALSAALDRAGGSVVLATFLQGFTGSAGGGLAYTRPLDGLADKAWLASVNVRPDSDGVVRNMPYGIVVDGRPVPSMAVVLSNGQGQANREFAVDFSIDRDAIDRISAIDVLHAVVAPSRIAGKKVIVGGEAVELHDFFNTPAGVMSGNLLEALAAETLLQGRALGSTGGIVTLAGLLVIALAAVAIGRLRWHLLLAATATAAFGVEAVATVVQAFLPVAIDTTPWLTGCFVLAVAVTLSEIDLRRVLQNVWHARAASAESILARVVDDNFAGILVVGGDGRIRTVSRAAGAILGVNPDLVGERAADVLPVDLNNELAQAFAAAAAGHARQRTGETTLLRRDGAERIVEYVATSSRVDSRGEPAGADAEWVTCLTFFDVTERRAAEDRVAHLARFDSMTELPNRNQLIERLDSATATDSRCAVVCFDLDGFKNVNDTLGHALGDQLLYRIARRAHDLLPPTGLVARFAGDEFTAIFAGDDADASAMGYAEHLVEAIAQPIHIGAHRVIVRASVGYALSGDIAEAGDALRKADIALSRAKSDGGNTVVRFVPDMLAAIANRQRLELELWQALDNGEFEVWYQPLVELRDSSIVGAEALLRWRHPERGLVPPDEFIPVAEAIGMIEPLGRWVLETACVEATRWPTPIQLSVNASSQQFVRSDMVETVQSALARSGLAASRLNLEITESLFMEPSQIVHLALARLRAAGIGIVLDDFGTGYSSLSYIHAFPIDKIKIDKSFVSGLPADRDASAIVRAVAVLACDLGVRLNAEGIESGIQADFLALAGVAEGQGHLFGKPQPAAEFRRLLEAQTAAKQVTA